MIRCADGSLYTGIATDVDRRFREHRRGGDRAAKYLRGRSPVSLVFSRKIGEKGQALKVEARIKKSAKRMKEALIADPSRIDSWLAGGA
jgi:putative endonuclease